MKKIFFISLGILLCLSAYAQVQNGYVRTRGTSTNRTGSPIPQAKVFIKGLNGAKVTADDGTFNFNLGGGKKQFSIKGIIKTGYRPLIPLAASYNVGKAPVTIVMQSDKENLVEKNRISKRIEDNIAANYKIQKDNLTAERNKVSNQLAELKGQNAQKLSDLEKTKRALEEKLAMLEEQYLQRNTLIDRMVNEYVNMDYAVMDARQAQLCSFIENGELERADSLLNTIDIQAEMQGLKAITADIQARKSQRALSEEILGQKFETAKYYFSSRYNIASERLQYDSAAYYIQQLADIDTTDFNNVYKCAKFMRDERALTTAEHYYLICLRMARAQYADGDETSTAQLARILNGLGYFYYRADRYPDSEPLLKEALTLRKKLASLKPSEYNAALAGTLNNLGHLYKHLHNYKLSEQYYFKTMEIDKKIVSENNHESKANLGKSYNNLGGLYREQKNYSKAEQYYLKALAIREQVAKSDTLQQYQSDLAATFNGLGELYLLKKDYEKAEKHFLQSVEIDRHLAIYNPWTYNTYLASNYNSLHDIYIHVGNEAKADYYKKQADELQLGNPPLNTEEDQ